MHVVVTGASSGIGLDLAREFGRAGAKVTLVARRRSLLEALAAEINAMRAGGEPKVARVVEHDLSDPNHAADFIPAAVEAFGPIDVLINNAGVQIVGPMIATSAVEGEKLVAVDLLSPLRLTQAVLPSMLERGQGTIVDVASAAAIAPTPGMTWYNAAKAGLAAASEALRGEVKGTGVHVVTVYPGIIASTDMAQAALEKYGKNRLLSMVPTGTTVELAKRVRRAVERKRDRVIYPSSMSLGRYFPNTTRRLMDAMTPKLS